MMIAVLFLADRRLFLTDRRLLGCFLVSPPLCVCERCDARATLQQYNL